jgi:hypothetical protein
MQDNDRVPPPKGASGVALPAARLAAHRPTGRLCQNVVRVQRIDDLRAGCPCCDDKTTGARVEATRCADVGPRFCAVTSSSTLAASMSREWLQARQGRCSVRVDCEMEARMVLELSVAPLRLGLPRQERWQYS